MTDLLEIKALHCLTRLGSWAKAASELGVSRSQLRQIVSRLEQRLGVALLDRSAGEVVLTEAGAAFQARTVKALDELAKVEASLQNTTVRPIGKVRISAPVVLGQTYVAPLVGVLRRRYPELAVELTLTDRFVDLVHEEIDMAVRVGSPFDARLTTRRLCTNRRVLVASPAYLERHRAPEQPQDLSDHDCILFTHFTNQGQWRLAGPGGSVTVPVSGMLSTNNGYVLNNLAEQGLGVTFGATLSLAPALLAGRLVRLLPQYEMEQTGIFVAHLPADELPSRVGAAIDFFAEHLTDPPSWDRQLAGKVPGF
jgi:DNA-binding transcriptional LysR family regulator